MTRYPVRLRTNASLQGAAVVATAGPVAYIGLVVVLGARWEGYDPIRQTQSELGSVQSPFGLLMNVGGFMALGLSVLAAAWVYHRGLRGMVGEVAATGLLVLAGISLIAVGTAPCDPGCVDVTTTGRMHSLLSAPSAIALPLAALVSVRVLEAPPFGRPWQIASGVLGALAMLSGPIVGLELLDNGDGLLQRAGMWTAILWLSAVSGRLLWALRRGLPRATT